MTCGAIERMKEDQTELITARLEHLQFMMDSGKMPIFRHRSDMFLFALEAHNIARGLSSRYYRLQEDLDIRFFIRFRFDYWLQEILQWVKRLDGAEYRVDDDDFFAEGRARRLTIIVNKLFGYHLDKLPADSAEGSMPLSEEEILEPFKAVRNMKSVDLVASFQKALQEVHAYLLKLAMMPVEWSKENRCKALKLYLDDSKQSAHVQLELTNYRYFCHMPGSDTTRSQFCYLRQRLVALTADGELAQLRLAASDQDVLFQKLCSLFAQKEFSPAVEQIPSNDSPMADDELFARFLYFVSLDGEPSFPLIDANRVSNYLIRKDVFLNPDQEQNLQALFALMEAMQEWFAPLLQKRLECSHHGAKTQERINAVMAKVSKFNLLLAPLIANGHTTDELDTFFSRLFSPDLRDEYAKAQDDLLTIMEKDRDDIKLKPYIQLLREAGNVLHIFQKKTTFGREIYQCLKDEAIVRDVNGDTVNSYYSKTDYQTDTAWRRAIKLVNAVAEEYKQTQ